MEKRVKVSSGVLGTRKSSRNNVDYSGYPNWAGLRRVVFECVKMLLDKFSGRGD